jgi:hypothetical protein
VTGFIDEVDTSKGASHLDDQNRSTEFNSTRSSVIGRDWISQCMEIGENLLTRGKFGA